MYVYERYKDRNHNGKPTTAMIRGLVKYGVREIGYTA